MTTRRRARARPPEGGGSAVAVRDNSAWLGEVRDAIDKPDRTRQLASLLGSAAAVDRFKTVALHAIVHDQERLRDCDPLSIVEAVREAASLGLEPTGILGESWVLPYGRTARLSIGYRGLLKLIRRSKAVSFIDAQVVYMADTFDVEFGTTPRIIHKPLMFGERDEKGELVADRGGYRGAYAWAALVGTDHPLIEWMPLADIEQVRLASPSVKAGRASPWDDWYAEMMRKSPVRRLAKRLPLDPVAEKAIAIEEENDDMEARIIRPTVSTPSPARAAALAAVNDRVKPIDPDQYPASGEGGPAEIATAIENDVDRGTVFDDDELDRLSRPLEQGETDADAGS